MRIAIVLFVLALIMFFTTLAINPLADCVYGGYIADPPAKNVFGATTAECNPAPVPRDDKQDGLEASSE